MPIDDFDKIVAAILTVRYATKRMGVESHQDFVEAYDKMLLELEKLSRLKKGDYAGALDAEMQHHKGER